MKDGRPLFTAWYHHMKAKPLAAAVLQYRPKSYENDINQNNLLHFLESNYIFSYLY